MFEIGRMKILYPWRCGIVYDRNGRPSLLTIFFAQLCAFAVENIRFGKSLIINKTYKSATQPGLTGVLGFCSIMAVLLLCITYQAFCICYSPLTAPFSLLSNCLRNVKRYCVCRMPFPPQKIELYLCTFLHDNERRNQT